MSVISLENTITFAISVKDRHASAEWYNRLLGFEILYHADEAGWSELQTKTAGVTLGLGEHTEPVPGNSVPVFGILDIEDARQKLEGEDVKFDGDIITIDGMAKITTFYDPDGNALMLAQDLSGAA